MADRPPKVTFIVLCFNYGRFLKECVESILGQTFEDFELLIMDDSSTDDTPSISSSIKDKRVVCVRNKINLGLPGNFNRGLQLSRGEIVWAISADDCLADRTALGRAIQIFETHASAGMVWSSAVPFEPGGGKISWCDHGDREFVWRAPTLAEKLLTHNPVCAPTVVVRRTVFDRIGWWPENLVFVGDWYFWFRVGFILDAVYTPEPLAKYRMHSANMTTAYRGPRQHHEALERLRLRLCMAQFFHGDTPSATVTLDLVRQDLDDIFKRLMDAPFAWHEFDSAIANRFSIDAPGLPEWPERDSMLNRICSGAIDNLLREALKARRPRRALKALWARRRVRAIFKNRVR